MPRCHLQRLLKHSSKAFRAADLGLLVGSWTDTSAITFAQLQQIVMHASGGPFSGSSGVW